VETYQIDEVPARGSSSARSSSQRGGVRRKQKCEDHIRYDAEALEHSSFLTSDAVLGGCKWLRGTLQQRLQHQIRGPAPADGSQAPNRCSIRCCRGFPCT